MGALLEAAKQADMLANGNQFDGFDTSLSIIIGALQGAQDGMISGAREGALNWATFNLYNQYERGVSISELNKTFNEMLTLYGEGKYFEATFVGMSTLIDLGLGPRLNSLFCFIDDTSVILEASEINKSDAITIITQQIRSIGQQHGAIIATLMTVVVAGLIINKRRNKQQKNQMGTNSDGVDSDNASENIDNNRYENNNDMISSLPESPIMNNKHDTKSWSYVAMCGLLIILTGLVLLFASGYWKSPISSILNSDNFKSVSYSQSAGIRFAKIQDVQVGERAIGTNPEVTDSERKIFLSDPEPATWRKLTLEMLKSDGKRLDITLLRPLNWISESKAEIGSTIFLDLPEMGAQGMANVLNIEPCPPIKHGKGNVITGTFHHEAANTIDVHVEGLSKPIGCTDNHPFWSVTRQEFIEAGKLQQGEQLQLYNGQTAKVIQILPRPGPERVHNLEVMNEHVYMVTDGGILVHNACYRFHADADNKGRITNVNATVTRRNIGTGQGTNQATRDHANELNTAGGKIDAGHIIARILGGGIGDNNIVPLTPSVNRGEMARLERRIARAVRDTGKSATITVELFYEGNSTRPSHIKYNATVGNTNFEQTFYN
jgi:hypothetical protein